MSGPERCVNPRCVDYPHIHEGQCQLRPDVPEDFPASHISMPINADGDGPEMDESKVTETICWSCIETWPCAAYQSDHPAGE